MAGIEITKDGITDGGRLIFPVAYMTEGLLIRWHEGSLILGFSCDTGTPDKKRGEIMLPLAMKLSGSADG
jgi:hypothetical protein